MQQIVLVKRRKVSTTDLTKSRLGLEQGLDKNGLQSGELMTDDSSLGFVVLVGRPRMALTTLGQLLALSSLAGKFRIEVFFLPGSLRPVEINRILNLSPNIRVGEVSLPLPRYQNSEMFWSRPNEYAKRFNRSRLGYLDMCYWKFNFFSEPRLRNYSLLALFDDDSDFIADPDPYIRRAMQSQSWIIASGQIRDGMFKPQHAMTREHLFDFVKNFICAHDISEGDPRLFRALELGDEDLFHRLPWTLGNFNIYRHAAFKSAEWHRWAYALNLFGGSHRFRWGEIETLGLFSLAHFRDGLLDLRMVDEGAYLPSQKGATVIRKNRILGASSILRKR